MCNGITLPALVKNIETNVCYAIALPNVNEWLNSFLFFRLNKLLEGMRQIQCCHSVFNTRGVFQRTTQADGVSTLDVGSVAGPRLRGGERRQSRNGVSENRTCVRLVSQHPERTPAQNIGRLSVHELLENNSSNSSHYKATCS